MLHHEIDARMMWGVEEKDPKDKFKSLTGASKSPRQFSRFNCYVLARLNNFIFKFQASES